MVLSCAAYGCTNRWKKDRKIQFHRFPLANPERLRKWVEATKRKSWVPTKYSYICSVHFTDDSYKSSSRRYLKNDAVPSIFNFPTHLQKECETERRVIVKYPLPELKKRRIEVPSCLPIILGGSSEIPDASAAICEHQTPNSSVAGETSGMLQRKSSKSSPTKESLRRKVKLLQQKLRRRDKKISNLQSLIETARKVGDMSDDTATMLRDTFGSVPFDILISQIQNNCKPNGKRYSKTMKEFALTLYFYSPRSYNYLRKHIHLPHPAMIRSWVSSVDCEPGFLEEAFLYLKDQASGGRFADCALIIDSMSIRKQVVWDKSRNRYSGYVECVGLVDGNEECLASEALVFIVVSLTERFKCPVAYFLIDKIKSNVLAKLIDICISKLSAINLRVWSVTGDGISSNLQAFQALGCKISGCTSEKDMQTFFLHSTSNLPVYIIFDPCHMLKLARNVLADKKVISSTSGRIHWDYLKNLNVLQDELGLKFANKLSGVHINFKNKKMNVSIAAQTLSSSTADALEFLVKTKNLKFSGAEPTIEYIRIIDRIFDLCNSRNPFGKRFKSPLNLSNQRWWIDIFSQTIEFLVNLKIDNLPVLQTPRKMFVLGFIVTIKSLTLMASQLLSRDVKPLKYFLTYKVSQDHIELFFNNIRACGGFNNNPNACQFRWSLRKLLLAKNVSSNNSNCINYESELPYSILEFRSPKRSLINYEINDEEKHLLMFSELLNIENLSYYERNILFYIGGYIVKNILAKCSCIHCIQMLTEENFHDYSMLKASNPKCFTNIISRGRLRLCSPVVFKIICIAEKAFKFLVIDNNKKINVNHIVLRITNQYLSNEGLKFQHDIDNELGYEDLHETQMTKKIIETYIKIRLKSYGKILTLQEVHGNKATIRQKLSKLILFNNV